MTTVQNIPVSQIVAGNNDRTHFNPEGIAELADSIRDNGLAQPITVRPVGDMYQFVAGERRYRAVCSLEWETIPAIVRDMTDAQADALMLAENLHRVDLNPVDEALAYRKRIDRYGWTQAECAKQCCVSAGRVSRRLALLELEPDVLHMVKHGHLTIGFGEALRGLDANRQRIAMNATVRNADVSLSQFKGLCGRLKEAQDAGLAPEDLPLFGSDFGATRGLFEMPAKAAASAHTLSSLWKRFVDFVRSMMPRRFARAMQG